MAPWRDPFADLRHTVRRLTIVTALCMLAVALVAVSGVSLAWYALREQVQQNSDTLIALCRQNNIKNADIRTMLLSFGVQPHELFELRPIVCDRQSIEERVENR